MIMFRKFMDRESELKALRDSCAQDRFTLMVVYGRRRVGKTELITKSAEGLPAIYFLADKRGTRSNLHRFRKKVAEFFGEFEPAVETFDEMFRYIVEKWKGEEKLVIIFDEFSYLAEKDASIPSVFQLIVDEIIGDKFHLILCGSSVSMMEKGVLAYSSPLYGRRTGQIKLKPLAFKELRKFYPGANMETLVQFYGAFGGLPFYHTFMDPSKDFYKNLSNTVLNNKNLLYAEGEFLLKEELRDPATFMNILAAIAKGATKASEIATKSFLQAKDLPYYLQILQNLGFVVKENPVLEKPTTKKSIYRIGDPFIRFWFTFVLQNKDALERGLIKEVLENIKKGYNEYLGQSFEEICKDFLFGIMGTSILPVQLHKLGRQWGKIPGKAKGENEYEIDFVGVNEETKDILFCECKWSGKKVDFDVLKELQVKSRFVSWNKNRKEHYAVISKSGFTMRAKEYARENMLLFDLSDMKGFYDRRSFSNS